LGVGLSDDLTGALHDRIAPVVTTTSFLGQYNRLTQVHLEKWSLNEERERRGEERRGEERRGEERRGEARWGNGETGTVRQTDRQTDRDSN